MEEVPTNHRILSADLPLFINILILGIQNLFKSRPHVGGMIGLYELMVSGGGALQAGTFLSLAYGLYAETTVWVGFEKSFIAPDM